MRCFANIHSIQLARCATTLLLGVLLAPIFAIAQPDIMQQNMNFDAQMNSQLQAMQQQNQQGMQNLVQNYIQQNGPQLQADYQQYVQMTGQQIPFEQFVYYHIMTQGGRNPGPGLEAQRQQFEGLQNAHRTQTEGFNSYNQGYWQNQQRLDNAAQRYDQQAIQGNQYYRNPQSGETVELPYAAQEGFYQGPQGNYVADPMGNYNQIDPQGYQQQLEQYNPYAGGNDD